MSGKPRDKRRQQHNRDRGRKGERPPPPKVGERPGEEKWEPQMLALATLIERTGAITFELRYQDDEVPTVWVAVAGFIRTAHDGREGTAYMVGAGLNPMAAAFDLAQNLVDGGLCNHCHKPTGLVMDVDPMPLEDSICWYRYVAQVEEFIPGCQVKERLGAMN